MSVVIETTLGDITVDLYLEQRPVTCLNFLKLCKMKYYNFNLFHTIRSGFIAQTGDPTGEGSGGQSVFGVLEGPSKRFFSGEKMPKIRHTDAGLLSMVCTGEMMVGSQFFFTLSSDLDSLDGIHCVIGEVSEGHEVLRKLNDVICDESHRPYRDVRITHTVVLEDPFNDPPGLRAPSRSPSPSAERLKGGRIAPDEEIDEAKGKSVFEVQEMLEEKEAKARATILEIIGDLPDADIAPPENVLFVCKLNPVTADEDLEIIFSRFGKIVSCEVIRDKKTGDSLQYAFIEFSDKKSCEDAYFKMDNVLIDDRRIHVDFSQSVSKIKWLGKGRGVKHLDDNEIQDNYDNIERSKKSHNIDQGHRNGRDPDINRDTHSERKRNKSRDRISDRERQHDRQQRSEKDSVKRDKNKSRSRSKSKLNRYRDETDDRHKNNTRHSEKNNDRRHDSHKDYNRHKEDSYKSRQSPSRVSKYKPSSDREKEDSRYTSKESNRENKERKGRDQTRKNRSNKETDNIKDKYRRKEKNESYKEKKNMSHAERCSEPRTPSPITDKQNKSTKKNDKAKHLKKSRSNKNKRKQSTSTSDSDTSDSSSSSSESTSSSDREKKKDKLKKRKRKYTSTSSSSSSDSSSTSTSSTSSSSSSSSTTESETDEKKRRKKTTNKKSKPKKKL